jgi:hypothetical protein
LGLVRASTARLHSSPRDPAECAALRLNRTAETPERHALTIGNIQATPPGPCHRQSRAASRNGWCARWLSDVRLFLSVKELVNESEESSDQLVQDVFRYVADLPRLRCRTAHVDPRRRSGASTGSGGSHARSYPGTRSYSPLRLPPRLSPNLPRHSQPSQLRRLCSWRRPLRPRPRRRSRCRRQLRRKLRPSPPPSRCRAPLRSRRSFHRSAWPPGCART